MAVLLNVYKMHDIDMVNTSIKNNTYFMAVLRSRVFYFLAFTLHYKV